MISRAFLGLAILASGSLLANCASNNPAASSGQSQPTQTGDGVAMVQPATNRQVDQQFIEMMLPHHQGAIEMAQLAVTRASNPEVKALAQKIIQEQTREIDQMQTWYRQWYGAEVPKPGMQQTGMGINQPNQSMSPEAPMPMGDAMNGEMLNRLKNTSAANFDRVFLQEMTQHHQMATMMAEMVVNSAQRPETRQLARSIINGQTAEIAQMQQLQQTIAQAS